MRSPFVKYFLLCMSTLLLVACSPQATPFPVEVIPTPSVEPQIPNNNSPIRYAFATNTRGFVADLQQFQSSGQVTQLTEAIDPNDLGLRYDIIIALGRQDGATRTDEPLRISLILNATTPPLDNPAMAQTLRDALQPEVIASQLDIPGIESNASTNVSTTTLRNEMANNGYPDGFSLRLGYIHAPGIDQLQEQLASIGINAQTERILTDDIADVFLNRFNAILIVWHSRDTHAQWAAQFGAENIIDLYAIPISYWAVPELNITFTPSGWPIATR
ncbi:MAG: hypothetical protein D6737_01525 [Chloroflexi bacterium]|nr:MAG: hypothetical protein D6737_01525 [Chloroflexota bacterium]